MSQPEIIIAELPDVPHHMDAVLNLHRAHRATLGFLSRGAFEDHCARRELLVALRGEHCVGYLMFRQSTRRRTATIVHLCTHPSARGLGVTHTLIRALRSRTTHLDGIRLNCRRDYDAHTLWPKLGFQLVDERPGRSASGHLLCTWWLQRAELPLLSRMTQLDRNSRRVVAVDANVFLDFYADTDRSDESKALHADWLDEHIELCVTAELRTELDRRRDKQERRLAHERASKFRKLVGAVANFETALEKTLAILGPATSEQGQSDRRQIAWAVAGNGEFFATRDSEVLNHADKLEDELRIVVARPAEIVRRVNALLEDARYEPRRFEGSRLVTRGPQTGPAAERRLTEAYLNSASGEKKIDFLTSIRNAEAEPQQSRLIEVVADGMEPLLLACSTSKIDQTLDYRLLRAGRSKLSATVLRQFLATAISNRNVNLFRISDNYVSPTVADALEDLGFLYCGDTWLKVAQLSVASVAVTLNQAAIVVGEKSPLSGHLRALVNSDQVHEAERTLWPAKFDDHELPAFVIPIRPQWAKDLFDTRLAEGDLFGLPPELGFSFENAYYRAPRPGVVCAPGRVLWYVSQEAGSIRACSYIDEVLVGPAKEMFRRFQRLGVYTWRNISKLADGDPFKNIMVLRFSGTELFEHPIDFHDIGDFFAAHGQSPNPLASPVQISNALFLSLYRTGRRITGRCHE